jgi:hypothetical protein
MTKQQKLLLANKLKFLKIALTISKHRLAGEEVPEELIKELKIARITADFSNEELENIVKC